MKRMLWLIFLTAGLQFFGFAISMEVPLEMLVQESDLIIVGTLKQVSGFSLLGRDYGRGRIMVDEVLWGPSRPGDQLPLTWDNPSGIVCPRVSHEGRVNKKGIWLLTFGREGEVRADYPGFGFERLDARAEIMAMLTQKPVVLHMHRVDYPYVSAYGPVSLSLVLRNATDRPQVFPGLEYKDGRLSLSPKIEFALYLGWGDRRKRVKPLTGRIMVSKKVAPFLLKPKQELKVTVDLAALYHLSADGYYGISCKMEGYDPAHEIDFTILPPRTWWPMSVNREWLTAVRWRSLFSDGPLDYLGSTFKERRSGRK